MKNNPTEKKYLFDKPKNVKIFMLGFYFVLICCVVAEFFIHKHTSFSWEEYPSFHTAFGFVAFVVMIIAGKYILRPLLKRKEDYYD
jgi:hypothetical protein